MSLGKGARTRERIIEEAIHLFHKSGIHWVSFQMIAERVGIRQASIYRHFEDKDDLLLACCAAVNAEAGIAIDLRAAPSLAAPERLEAYVAANLDWVLDHPERAHALMGLYYFAACSPKLRSLHRAIDEGGIARIAAILLQGTRERAWRARDIAAQAREIQSYLTGELIKAFHRPEELSRKSRARALSSAVSRMSKR
jgi:AcrR family transcriptional regulator